MVKWKRISDFEGPEESPGFLLWQVSSQWRREVEAGLALVGLTHTQFVLLANLGWLTREGGDVSQVELARHCKMDVTMTSQVLRSLEKKGYLDRRFQKGDQRAKFLCLTERGAALIEKALPLIEKIDRKFFNKLGKDVEKWVAMLQKLMKVEIKTNGI